MPYNPGSGTKITSEFGPRGPRGHYGMYFAPTSGSNPNPAIPAAMVGTVDYSGLNSVYGNTVILKHTSPAGSTYYTLYAHLTGDGMPSVGEVVAPGDTIGFIGNTGASDGAHLHFEVITGATPNGGNGGPLGINGTIGRVDPRQFDFGAGVFDGGALPPPQSNSALTPLPSQLGGPIDLAQLSDGAGWATTAVYADGTIGPGLLSGDMITFDNGAIGEINISGTDASGIRLFGSLEVRDSADDLIYQIFNASSGDLTHIYDAANTEAWSQRTLQSNVDGRVIADNYNFSGSLSSWYSDFDLGSLGISAWDTGTAGSFVASLERAIYAGDVQTGGAEAIFEDLGPFRHFTTGSYDIDFENVTLDTNLFGSIDTNLS